MLNYDFYKIQNILKENIILNSKINNIFDNIIKNNNILKIFLSIDYNNNMIIKKHQEIKFIINNINIKQQQNYIITKNNINYIFLLTTNSFDLLDFFSEEYNPITDKVILCIAGIFSPFIDYCDKIDYTFISMGLYNYTNYKLNNNIYKYKKCINIGYNTNSDSSFPGISIGVPLYNCHYNFYNSINEFIYKEFKIIYNNFNKLFKQIKNNYNILNIIKYNDYINNLDDKKYISIQDFLFYLYNLYNIPIKDIKIYYQNNNYLYLDKNENLYQFYLLQYKTKMYNLFIQSFNKFIDNNKKNINFLSKLTNENFNIPVEKKIDNLKIDKIKINKNEISLKNYLKILDNTLNIP